MLLLLLSCFGFIYIKRIADSGLKIMLSVDGEKIGYIENTAVVTEVLTEITGDIYVSTGTIYRFDGKLSYEIEIGRDAVDYADKDELYAALAERSSDHFIKAYALYIDGRFIAACADENEVKLVLKKLEQEETSRIQSVSSESAVLDNKIAVTEQMCLTGEVLTGDQLYKKLKVLTENSRSVYKTAQAKQISEEPQNKTAAGYADRTVSVPQILSKTISAAADEKNENDVKNDVYESKQTGKAENNTEIIVRGGISAEVNYGIEYGIPRVYTAVRDKAKDKDENQEDIIIRFRYLKYETVTETAERKNIYRYNQYLFRDFEAVLEEGRDGIRSTTYKLEYAGDKLITRQAVRSQVLQAPADRIIIKGLKKYPAAGVTEKNYIWPLALPAEPVITSVFGECRPLYDGNAYHFGIDLQVDEGTEVLASNGGTVSYVNRTNSYGIMIIIDHESGIQTCYAHLGEAMVEVGEIIYQGQKIALSGNTGVSTRPHLHFEMRLDNIPVDPFIYLHEKPWEEHQ